MSPLCPLSHGTGANQQPLDREAAPKMLLCLWHRGLMTRTVSEIRELWHDLSYILEAGSAPRGDETPKTRHLKAAEAPAPANLEVLALRDPRSHTRPIPARDGHTGDNSQPILPVTAIIAEQLLRVADERPLTGKLPSTMNGQLAALMTHHDWIAAQDWVDAYIEKLGDVKQALKTALRDRVSRRIGTCKLPSEKDDGMCGGVLMLENGSDVVRCVECGAAWASPQERARLAVSLEIA